jgi:hypothetical protein
MTLTSFKFLLCFLLTIYFGNVTKAQSDFQYDIVLVGGRVIDPETKLNAIKNVAFLTTVLHKSRFFKLSLFSVDKKWLRKPALVIAGNSTAMKQILFFITTIYDLTTALIPNVFAENTQTGSDRG